MKYRFVLIAFFILKIFSVNKIYAEENKIEKIFRSLNYPTYTYSFETDGVLITWADSKFPMDMRKNGVLGNLKIDPEKIFDQIKSNHWLLATCEIVKNNGARGFDREWKGDILGNINANVFIPVKFFEKDKDEAELFLHRAISLAVYKVLKSKLKIFAPNKSKKIRLKWINDVIIDEKKICGIKPDEFDTNPDIVSYQFGVNINMSKEELSKIDQAATSLSEECGRSFDHRKITKEIIIELVKILKKYKGQINALDKKFSKKMAFIGDEVTITEARKDLNFEGILEEVKGGRIFIRQGDGILVEIHPGSGILRKKK